MIPCKSWGTTMSSELTEAQKKFMEPVSEVGNRFLDLLNENPEWEPNAVSTALSALLASIIGENAATEDSRRAMIVHVSEYLEKKSSDIFKQRVSND